jgi:serine/threonine protein kinase/tetratricopeptide (TPR) repeat protein
MGTQDERARVRSAIRGLMEADRAADGLRPSEHYRGLFAGHGDLVSEVYLLVAAAGPGDGESHDGATIAPRPSMPDTTKGGGRSRVDAGGGLGSIGPYRLVRELGSGGMGRVYHAVCERRVAGLHEGEDVALKVVHAHLVETEGFFKRFLREAEIGKKVRHPNVVRTLDVDAGSLHGKPVHFLVMEFVEGQTLRALLEEVSRVPEALCLHIAREAGKGLSAIHGLGVVHRDFKPENVLITKDQVVKVMDLGVARLADEAVRLSMTGAFVGTLPYAAPEQFLGGGKDLDGRADLYALGLTLYELSTGQPAFPQEDLAALLRRRLHEEPRPPSAFNPQLSPYFEELVKTLVARDREKRFASAAAMGEVLEQGEAGTWWRRRSGEIRAETKRPLRRIRIPRDTALFGREPELAKLRALWEKAKAGEGQVVLLEGEAGIGKSRLVDELVGLLQQEGEELHFLFGSYPPGGAATAVGALSTACREHFGAEDLEGTLASLLAAVPLVIPSFAALLRGEPPPKGAEPLSKESLQTAFVETTRSLARGLPTVVLVDDLHFAPEEGRALLMALALAIPGHRVLLVGTGRPGLPAEWTSGLDRLGHASRISLGRLGPKDLQGLLAEAFRSERLAEELGGKIAAKSDGNPFFVFEILRSLREGGALRRREDGTWVRSSEFREIEIPSSVTDLVRARVGRLSEEERNLLDVAACCGFEFDPLLVGAVLGLGKIPVLQRLAGIEKTHRLVRSAGRRFVFDHHQVQEVLYAGLPDLLREEYHAAVGEALERREGAAAKEPKDLPGALAADLCAHLLKGGRGEAGKRYLVSALEHLTDGYRMEAILDLSLRGLSEAGLLAGRDRVDVLLLRARALEVRGRVPDMAVVLREALSVADATGEPLYRARANARWCWYLFLSGSNEDFEKRARIALDCAREAGDPREEADACRVLSAALRTAGRTVEAMPVLEDCLRLARSLGDRAVEASALGNIGNLLDQLGRPEESREYKERSLALVRELGLRRPEALGLGFVGDLELRLGRSERARPLLERSLQLSLEIGDRFSETLARRHLGYLGLWEGRLESAIGNFRDSLDLGRRSGLERLIPELRVQVAELDLMVGEPERALEGLEEIRRLPNFQGNDHHAATALIDTGFAWMELGRFDAAEGALEEAETHARRYEGSTYLVLHLLDTRAGLCVRRGRDDQAAKWLDEALGMAHAGVRGTAMLAPTARRASLPGGDRGKALEVLREFGPSASHYTRLETRFLLWRATGDRAHLEEAHRLLIHLRDHAPAESRESLMRGVWLHREVAAARQGQTGE